MNSSINDFVFIEKERKIIADENQLISSSINVTTSTTFDGIDQNHTVKVTLSFESSSRTIYALKSMSVHRLLLNKYLLQQLHMNVPLEQCVLILEDANKRILTYEDAQKALSEYLITKDEPIQIRISILIEIEKHDDKQSFEIPISSRNTTIEQLIQLTAMPIDIYKYLASNTRKCVLSNHELISNLNETKFLLVKENETCLVSVKLSDELQLIDIDDDIDRTHRFVISATVGNVYKQTEIDATQEFLLYSNDFVPAHSIPLVSFSPALPIKFTVIGQNLPVSITVVNDEHSMKFHCSRDMQMKRLLQIACQLFNIKSDYYQLTYLDSLVADDDMPLDDIDRSMTNAEWKLVCNATLNASLKYLDQTVLLPCTHETKLTEIVQIALTKFQIPHESMDMYELFALEANHTQVEFDILMDDVAGLFDPDTSTIPLELKKKDDN